MAPSQKTGAPSPETRGLGCCSSSSLYATEVRRKPAASAGRPGRRLLLENKIEGEFVAGSCSSPLALSSCFFRLRSGSSGSTVNPGAFDEHPRRAMLPRICRRLGPRSAYPTLEPRVEEARTLWTYSVRRYDLVQVPSWFGSQSVRVWGIRQRGVPSGLPVPTVLYLTYGYLRYLRYG